MTTALIIGAGHAGSQCAVSLRSEGFQGTIIVANDDVDVPYHKPPLSKKYLAAEIPSSTPLRAASAYVKANVQWVHQSVIKIDTLNKRVSFHDKTTQEYDHLIIATGARNRTLPTLVDCQNVFSLRTLNDAARLHEKLSGIDKIAILGGGFIGLEVAACLASLDKQVTVIEAADRLLGRVVAAEISTAVKKGLTDSGITIKTGCTNSEFIIDERALKSIEFPDAPSLSVDAMLVGIGATPNSKLASDSGIKCDNGIVVNEFLKTSADSVYAIGDCAQYPHWQTGKPVRLESVQNAVEQAKVLAKSIASSTPETYRTVPWFWSDIGSMKLQIAGIKADDTRTLYRETDGAIALYHLKDSTVVCVETVNSSKDHMLARKLIDRKISVTDDAILDGADALKALLG